MAGYCGWFQRCMLFVILGCFVDASSMVMHFWCIWAGPMIQTFACGAHVACWEVGW